MKDWRKRKSQKGAEKSEGENWKPREGSRLGGGNTNDVKHSWEVK